MSDADADSVFTSADTVDFADFDGQCDIPLYAIS